METNQGIITEEIMGKIKEAAHICNLSRQLTEREQEVVETYATQEQLQHLFSINPSVRN